MEKYNEKFMFQAIELAKKNVASGNGGPFAALVVKDGEVIAAASNSVIGDNDPTAHAEVNAIRMACQKLRSFQLDGCVIYSSCEPCPMCFGAIYWARPDAVYYASTKEDAASVDFDDSFIYKELALSENARSIPFIHKIVLSEGLSEWQLWKDFSDKIQY